MSPKETEYSVLVVDDDKDMRYAISRILEKCHCRVESVDSVEGAMVELSEHQYDFVFSDMRFHGGMDGEELLEHVTSQYPTTDVVLISCAMDSQRKKKLLSLGASMCLQKPFFKDTCLEVIRNLSETKVRKAA